MIESRLLVDLEAVVELDSLPKRSRSRLLLFFEKLRTYPGYALEENDPFRDRVIAQWSQSRRINE